MMRTNRRSMATRWPSYQQHRGADPVSTNPLDLHVDVVTEDGQWSMVFAGLPIAGKGGTLPNLVEDTIAALQECAQGLVDDFTLHQTIRASRS